MLLILYILCLVNADSVQPHSITNSACVVYDGEKCESCVELHYMNKKGEWRLSPAYDITYSYKPSGLWTNHHQLRVNNKIDDITYDDLIISAKNMGINEKDAIEIINNTINVSKNVYNYADKAYLPKNIIAFLKDKFVKF